MIDKLKAELLESRRNLEKKSYWDVCGEPNPCNIRKSQTNVQNDQTGQNSRYKKQLSGLHRWTFHHSRRKMGKSSQKKVLKRMPTSLIIVKRNTNLLKRTKILILENNELKYMVQACLKV